MAVGACARQVLGPRAFAVVGGWYRSLFVDLESVVDAMPTPPRDAVILDVGGGDGALLDRYLARHPYARATMIDLAPSIGGSLGPDARARTALRPGTSIAAYAKLNVPPDLVFVCDVVHHIPVEARAAFFADLRSLLAGHSATLVVKDVEPGSMRARFAWLADRYVSGDRRVSFIGGDALAVLIESTFPSARRRDTPLLAIDPPNYCVIFSV